MSEYRVLVIDDDELIRDMLTDSLELSGYEVQTASDGVKGVECARQMVPDLVVLDVQMPELDGFEVLRSLREDAATRETPVLMLSSLNKPHLKIKALEAGADDYITKDTLTVELIARVRAALRRAARYRHIEASMSGNIEEVGFDALLQTLQIGMRSARVQLPDVGAEVVLWRGGLQSCTFRKFTGSDALARVLLAARGPFSVQMLDETQPDGKHQSVSLSSALMDAAVVLDEAKRALGQAPEFSTTLAIVPKSTGIDALEAMRPLFPMPLLELVVSLQDDVRTNALTVAAALRSGVLHAIEP